jgi:hypothetical protein
MAESRPHGRVHLAKFQGCAKDPTDFYTSGQSVSGDSAQASRGNAAALRTVRISSKLARRNDGLEIRREAARRSGE